MGSPPIARQSLERNPAKYQWFTHSPKYGSKPNPQTPPPTPPPPSRLHSYCLFSNLASYVPTGYSLLSHVTISDTSTILASHVTISDTSTILASHGTISDTSTIHHMWQYLWKGTTLHTNSQYTIDWKTSTDSFTSCIQFHNFSCFVIALMERRINLPGRNGHNEAYRKSTLSSIIDIMPGDNWYTW